MEDDCGGVEDDILRLIFPLDSPFSIWYNYNVLKQTNRYY